MPGEIHISGIRYTVSPPPATETAENINITGHTVLSPQGMRIVSRKDLSTVPAYLPDYRLQLSAVNNAPRLKVGILFL